MNSNAETTVEFRTHRFDPQQKKPSLSVYTVPVRKGMTILDALVYIKDNLDETLTFRHSCRMGQCGSCGVMVNGTPMLACYTQVLHLESDVLVIEPLSNMPIIKDLVVDIQPFFDTYNKIKAFLIKTEDEFKKPSEFLQMPTDLKKYWDLTLCTKCSICYSICPAAIDEKFPGPSTLATNYRFISDSRDEGSDERLKAMTDNVWLCTSCNSCTLFCPKEVDSSSSIVDERSLIVETGFIPRAVMDVLTSAFKYHNPMGMHPSKRIEWAKDLKIKTPNSEDPVTSLSGGNQQRVVLAKWLATNPKIFILDGPTIGVDIASKSNIHRLIRECAHRGMGVIIISDEVPEVIQNCNRIMVMSRGVNAGILENTEHVSTEEVNDLCNFITD